MIVKQTAKTYLGVLICYENDERGDDTVRVRIQGDPLEVDFWGNVEAKPFREKGITEGESFAFKVHTKTEKTTEIEKIEGNHESRRFPFKGRVSHSRPPRKMRAVRRQRRPCPFLLGRKIRVLRVLRHGKGVDGDGARPGEEDPRHENERRPLR